MDAFKDEFVPNIQSANKTSYNQWRQSNPGEAQKWEAYRDAVIAHEKGEPAPAPPTLATKYGKALVAAGKLQVSVTDLGSVYDPPPEPPPLPTGTLTWTPPGYPSYTGYTVVHVSNSSFNFSTAPRQGRNLLAIWDSPVTDSGGSTDRRVTFSGWRNVVCIGGEVNRTGTAHIGSSNNVGIQIDKCDGIVHIEGVKIHGQGVIDAFVTTTGPEAGGSGGATIRIQNCFHQANSIASIHSDGIQIWGDPGGGFNGGFKQLDIDHLTIHSSWQGIFMGTRDGCMQGGDYRNLNIVGIAAEGGATQSGLGWIFFKGRNPDIGNFTSTLNLTNCWGDNSIRMWTSIPNMYTPNTSGDDGEGNLNTARRSSLSTDGFGQFVQWADPNSDIKGRIYWGRPPANLGGLPGNRPTTLGSTDFVPENGNVGMSYVSPGYQ